ncbi:hypothetical protein JG688_00007441 [Phytophthora aleatoria]|uniref:Rhodanese domain-containing protein n=1 Tax=Phytophthora aleatoria TaxID=2496075 RepID=A0A8J5J9N0_9STRA|nr:hypothetical protein JG688_00007441 [Phytophthora aleatoria]
MKKQRSIIRQISRLIPKASTEVVKLSYWIFAVWWVVILGVHVVTCVYTALYAYSYWKLQDTFLNLYLESLEIGMPSPYHHTIATVHMIMSALHAVCIVLMLGGSIRHRSLAFTPWASCDADAKHEESKSDRTSSVILQSFTKIYEKISDRHGLCGVNSDHFHGVLVLREVIETMLQTMQAYRMSLLLPRTLLNRFYVVLLAVNCWSSVIVYSFFFKRDEARRRLACIVLDCVLDFMSCMGVELMVLLSYAGDYSPSLLGFPEIIWYNDEWVARALNELKIVVVVSWSDLASRSIFSLGLILTTMSMKELGKKDEVDEKWREFDASTVVQLLIRHCPELEMPDIFSDFRALRNIKVYNTTIHEWEESAAITSTNHPEMSSLLIVRVNMTDGLLPAGFLSTDFPQTLYDIEICVTNLRTLPDDLDSKWPLYAIIQVEYSQLTSVPAVLPRLEPYYLALTGNPLSEIPPEVFEVQGMLFLSISNMNLHQLPRNVTHLSAELSWIFIGDTNISFFWAWTDELVERMTGRANPWLAGPSPYCDDLEKIETGAATEFGVPLSPEYSQTLMDPSEANRNIMEKRIPQNPKYKNTQSKIDSGTTVNKVRLISHKEFLKRRDETFRRITCHCLAELFNEYEDIGGASQPEMVARMVKGANGEFTMERVPVGEDNQESSGPRIVSYEADEMEDYDAPYLVLDTRSKEEFATNRIHRSKNYPTTFLNRDVLLPEMHQFKNQDAKLIILYDLDDKTVAQTAHTLVQRGFDNIYVLTGGLIDYADAFPEHIEGTPLPPKPVDPARKNAKRDVYRGSSGLSSTASSRSVRSMATRRKGTPSDASSVMSNRTVADSVISKATARKERVVGASNYR